MDPAPSPVGDPVLKGKEAEPARPAPGSHAMSRIMAFMNQKGGVGKTTTVVNLASGIAALGRTALIVDLDPQAHATLHLGIDPEDREVSVYDLLLNPPGEESGIDPLDALVCARPNLGLIPAIVDQAAIETELANEHDRHARLIRSLRPLREIYEFVLIDCPPSLGLLTLNGLAAAREVIVPMQAHFLALQGVGKLLETVQLVGQRVNEKLRVSGIILCMHEENTRHAREVVSDIEAFFDDSQEHDVPWKGAKVYRPAVRRNIKVAESPSFGQTIFEYAAGCPGAQDYGALAAELVAEWDKLAARRSTPGADRPPHPIPQVIIRGTQPSGTSV